MTMIEIPLKRRGIIYCSDCKFRYEEGYTTHYYWCRLHDRPVDDTDYCSWAWAKESEVEE